MTIEAAIEKLIASEVFKDDARKYAHLRVFLSRYRKGKIKKTGAIELLMKYGYEVYVKKAKK